MKKFIGAILFSVLAMSGCGQTSVVPQQQVDSNTIIPSNSTQKVVDAKRIEVKPAEIVKSIEKQIASEKMFTYDLPIANSVITKREITGFLDSKKTGKISRITVGVATVNEHYYYVTGELVASNIETVVEGKTKAKEILLKDNKIVSFKNDGVDGMKDPYLSDLENGIVADGAALLTEFVDRKLNNE